METLILRQLAASDELLHNVNEVEVDLDFNNVEVV